jgi:hypothetical protein
MPTPARAFLAPAILLLMVPAALLAPAADRGRSRDFPTARHFPMKVGHRWVYADGEGEVAFEVLRSEKAGGGKVFVVRRTAGRERVDFRVAVEEEGVYVLQEGEKKFDPPLRQFAFFARPGDGWKWRGTYGGRPRVEEFENLGVQEVEVPAGTFKAVAVQQTNPANGDRATFWLARGVGVVRLSGKTEEKPGAPGSAKVAFEWRLKKFEAGRR